MKSRAFRLDGHWRGALFLADQNRDAMAADAVEKLSYRTVVQIGEVCAVELCVVGQILRQVEAEGKLSLEPGLDRVTI